MEYKCKNVECANLISKNQYCSLTCRNVYVNKHLRNYAAINTKTKNEQSYLENPKLCLKCNIVINYDKRRQNYCSHSCHAAIATTGRVVSKKTKLKIQKKLNFFYSNKIELIKCKHCDMAINSSLRIKYCSDVCRKKFRQRNLTSYQAYKQDCKFNFNLNSFPKEFNFELIKTYGWYKAKNKGNNMNGVSRDHMYSIKDGFKNNIDPMLISHPANCKLILQRENAIKNTKSSITLLELKNKIQAWNLKYDI